MRIRSPVITLFHFLEALLKCKITFTEQRNNLILLLYFFHNHFNRCMRLRSVRNLIPCIGLTITHGLYSFADSADAVLHLEANTIVQSADRHRLIGTNLSLWMWGNLMGDQLVQSTIKGRTANSLRCADPLARVNIILQSDANHWMPIGSVPRNAIKGEWKTFAFTAQEPDLLDAMAKLHAIRFQIQADVPITGDIYPDDLGFIFRTGRL